MSNPDYAAFKRALKEAVSNHFTVVVKSLSGDKCNGYCLYANDEVSSIGPVANRVSALKSKPSESRYNYYRYSADEWSEWDDFELFRGVNELICLFSKEETYFSDVAPKLLTLCAETLAESKAAGVFAAGTSKLSPRLGGEIRENLGGAAV